MIPGHVFFYKWLTKIEQEQFENDFEKLREEPLNSYLMLTFANFRTFLYDSFIWADSKQGGYYWTKIYNNRKIPLIE